jgi:mannose-1-phosphate guanylyltransferase
MRAVILVGGIGTRLQPLTATVPKPLLPLVEVTMIERVLGHLHAHGVEEAVLSMGYRPDAFMTAFPDDCCAGVSLRYAVEPEPLDTAGAIRFAAELVGIDDIFVVSNGDIITDLDVSALVAFHRRRDAAATLALTKVDDPSAYGVVVTNVEGQVTGFFEKPKGPSPSNMINAGIYVIEPRVLADIPRGRRVSVERETFPFLAQTGNLYALDWDGYWADAGTPATYLQVNLDILSGQFGPPAPGAALRPDGTWVLGAAVIEGDLFPPAFVGDAALVASGAQVRSSAIGAGARVMMGASVSDSVLFPGALVEQGAVIEESIVGEDAVVGEGAEVRRTTVVGCHARVAPGERLVGARVG